MPPGTRADLRNAELALHAIHNQQQATPLWLALRDVQGGFPQTCTRDRGIAVDRAKGRRLARRAGRYKVAHLGAA